MLPQSSPQNQHGQSSMIATPHTQSQLMSCFAFCCYGKIPPLKATWKVESLFHLTGQSSLVIEARTGAKDRKLEAETETQSIKEHFLLVFSLLLAQLALSYIPELSEQGQHHSYWDIVKKTSRRLAHWLIR